MQIISLVCVRICFGRIVYIVSTSILVMYVSSQSSETNGGLVTVGTRRVFEGRAVDYSVTRPVSWLTE